MLTNGAQGRGILKTIKSKSMKIQIIVIALALAVAGTAFAQTTAKKTLDTACIQAAVEARDTSISSAVGTFGTAWQAAVDARKVALKAAWSNTDKTARKAALKAAWAAYKTAHKNARTNFETTRKAAWKTYKSAAKACGTSAANDDPTSENIDAKVNP
jgi:hypothetical protein